ncbi:hypothetical protein [Flavobacterium capsici]|uniref:Lipoprotein n=1 Tax=Flavobacterium capsici TaxID=3075618 RepID=A0AA96F3N5_9FLAO|nr:MULTISPECIES: hypothetical protein [unclassified Flavobacterium]WNM18382.1 hypothetical protein RN608_10195 [Flavobacterium sp. PMR2A8]WNM22433.1 hypothetical protein RN605_03495 [Flavobacterium sp. PMTSA4]
MKRILSIVTLIFLINACDDGDLQVENIDFADVTAQKCNSKDVIYKIKDSEILFIEIPLETNFLNDETPVDTPRTVQISSTVKVTYRQYNGNVTQDNICPTVPSATPNVLEEWTATSGTIQITSTAIKTTNTTTGATKITGYKHYIVFKDITFQKPTGIQTYETYIFGNYNTTVTNLPLNFDEESGQKSTCSESVYNFGTSEVLTFNPSNFSTLFANEVTTTPRTVLIDASNTISYRLFSGTINNEYFCTTPTPTTPTLNQQWNAVDGVAGTSGIVEVTTTTFGTSFQHTIHLKNVSLKKGNSTFNLGNDFIFGKIITTP